MIRRAEDKGDGGGGGAAGTIVADAGKADAKTAAADTTLGKAAAEARAAETAKAGEAKADAKTEAKAEKPAPVEYEKWAPKPVDGIKRDDRTIGQFREAGKKFGLSAEQMQGLVDFDDARTKTMAAEFRASQAQQQKDWLESLKADKELGGAKWNDTKADLERAMKKFGDEDVRQLLNESGYGDHPALVKFVARIGKTLREDSIASGPKTGATGAKKPTLLDQLYGPAPAKS